MAYLPGFAAPEPPNPACRLGSKVAQNGKKHQMRGLISVSWRTSLPFMGRDRPRSGQGGERSVANSPA